MKRLTIIRYCLAVAAILVLTSCPMVYPGGGSVNFSGRNNSGLSLGTVRMVLTENSGNVSYEETKSFGATGTLFASIPWVEAGDYSLRIVVKDTSGVTLGEGNSGFWIAEGEQKTVSFSYDGGGVVSIGNITGTGGSSGVYLESTGAGLVWQWDDPFMGYFRQYSFVGGWGNLTDLAEVEIAYPDRTIRYSPGMRDLNIEIMTDDSGSFLGVYRKDYLDYGIYSWQFRDSLGNGSGGEKLLDPLWTQDKVAYFDVPSIDMANATFDWMITDPTGIFLAGIVVSNDDRQVKGFKMFTDPAALVDSVPPYDSYMTGFEYELILLTLDTPITQEVVNSFYDVSLESLIPQLILSPGGPSLVGVHSTTMWVP